MRIFCFFFLLFCVNFVACRNVFQHIYEINRLFDNQNLIYGDICKFHIFSFNSTLVKSDYNDESIEDAFDLTPNVRMKAIIKDRGSNRWAKNRVPYEISNSYSAIE
jgi:hypothetical protein